MQFRSSLHRCIQVAVYLVFLLHSAFYALANDRLDVHASEKLGFTVHSSFTSRVLENGLRVSVLGDKRMPIVTVHLTYRIGSAHEDEGTRGLAHLFEHLMFSATSTHPHRAVFNHVEQLGGSTNAMTNFDETRYYASTPPGGHVKVLEIYADRMANLRVTEEDLARDKKIVLEELRVSSQNDPINRLAFDALRKGFGEHPYAISPLGTVEDLNKTTVDDCIDFYEKYYGPSNAHLVVVGAVDEDATLALIQDTFGQVKKEVEKPPEIPSLESWDFPSQLDLREDIPPVEVSALVFNLPGSNTPDYEAIQLMSTLLNGIDGFEDEIVGKKGRAIFAQSLELSTKAGRVLGFGSVSLPYRRKETAFVDLQNTLNELAQFKWLTEQTLKSAKSRYLRREYAGRYSSYSMAFRIEFAAGWRGEIDRAFDREDRIEAVEIDDVKGVFRRYVMEGNPTRIHIKPENVPWYVTMFGWLYPAAEKFGLTRFFL